MATMVAVETRYVATHQKMKDKHKTVLCRRDDTVAAARQKLTVVAFLEGALPPCHSANARTACHTGIAISVRSRTRDADRWWPMEYVRSAGNRMGRSW